jgi:hypothetical protein
MRIAPSLEEMRLSSHRRPGGATTFITVRTTPLIGTLLALALAGCASGPPAPFTPEPASTPPLHLDANASLLVTTRGGRPIAGALVMLHGPHDPVLDAVPPRTVLELVDDRLLPRSLAIPVGSTVAFRNASELAHEIYTFSQPRPFAARLTPKAPPATIVFDRPGLVVLGCKLHGETIAYLQVTDAARTGTTDADGYLRLVGLLPGDYRAQVWRAPAARDQPALEGEQKFTLVPGGSRLVRVKVR